MLVGPWFLLPLNDSGRSKFQLEAPAPSHLMPVSMSGQGPALTPSK